MSHWHRTQPIARGGIVAAHVLLVGASPGLVQEVPLAELYALLQAVTNSVPDERGIFTFYTDCMWVIDSFHKRLWKLHWGRAHGFVVMEEAFPPD